MRIFTILEEKEKALNLIHYKCTLDSLLSCIYCSPWCLLVDSISMEYPSARMLQTPKVKNDTTSFDLKAQTKASIYLLKRAAFTKMYDKEHSACNKLANQKQNEIVS